MLGALDRKVGRSFAAAKLVGEDLSEGRNHELKLFDSCVEERGLCESSVSVAQEERKLNNGRDLLDSAGVGGAVQLSRLVADDDSCQRLRVLEGSVFGRLRVDLDFQATSRSLPSGVKGLLQVLSDLVLEEGVKTVERENAPSLQAFSDNECC